MATRINLIFLENKCMAHIALGGLVAYIKMKAYKIANYRLAKYNLI